MTSSGHSPAPVVETDRLRLRGHTLRDFQAMMSMWNDPIVTRFIGGRPHTQEEVWQRMLRYAGSWTLLGHGFWLIEEKVSRRVVGEVGVMHARREIDPPFGDDREVGWALLPGEHGKGYASEALAAALAWEEKTFNAPCLVALIDPDNAPSIRLARRFGFTERVRTTYKNIPTIQFERRRQA